MRQKIVWFMALLLVGAMLQGVSATSYGKQGGVHTYTVSVNGQKIPVTVRNGMVHIPNTPGMDRKEVFMAVNRYFSLRHQLASGPVAFKGTVSANSETASQWSGPDSDYEQRKAFSIPHQGDVYISAYASLSIEKDQLFVVTVGGYSSAACWIQPYDYWWSQSYPSKQAEIDVTIKFVGISVSVSVPPSVSFSGNSDKATYKGILYNTDYIGEDFSGIQAASTFGINRVEDHTAGTFLFDGTFYIEGANVYKVRGGGNV